MLRTLLRSVVDCGAPVEHNRGMSAPGGTGGYGAPVSHPYGSGPGSPYPPPAQRWWAPPPLPYGIGSGDGATLPRMHPMSAVDILDGAFALLKANASKLLVVVAVFAVPVQLVSAYLSRDLFSGHSLIGVFDNPAVVQTASSGGPSTGVRLLLTVLGWLGVAVAGGAISHVVGAGFVGRDEPAGAGLRAAGSRCLALIAAAIVVHLAELAGFAAVILPGLLVTAASVAVSPAVVIEGLGPIAGVRRSWRLISPRLWPTAGGVILTGIVA